MDFLKGRQIKAVVIGGSAGSFPVVTNILKSLKDDFNLPIFLTLHRLKHIRSGFAEALEIKSKIPVIEPFDKEKIKGGNAYLAPSNYHMLVELGGTIALSTGEMHMHSRPSIDLTYYSSGYVYNNKLLSIILSGANRDGVDGMRYVKSKGGLTMVQDPKECKIDMMTQSTIDAVDVDAIVSTEEIIKTLNSL